MSIVNEILAEINQVVKGKEDVVQKVLAAMLAEGHILLEDIPGVGKTTMALAFSKALEEEAYDAQATLKTYEASVFS